MNLVARAERRDRGRDVVMDTVVVRRPPERNRRRRRVAARDVVVDRVVVTAGERVRLACVDVDPGLGLTDQGVVLDRRAEAHTSQIDSDAAAANDVAHDRRAGVALDRHVDADIGIVESFSVNPVPLTSTTWSLVVGAMMVAVAPPVETTVRSSVRITTFSS